MHSLYIQGKMTRTLLCFDEFISFTTQTKHVDFNKKLILNFNVMPESQVPPSFNSKYKNMRWFYNPIGPPNQPTTYYLFSAPERAADKYLT